ncbi:mechanosensitive ion channel family protein [Methanobrevibacter olleyae]|uniref:Mechanosensitive ion channel n=1 Tax=Methanobrevibacter olleyae TaxID=294671 RepID=A0A126QXE6_METOL|nr:mechanosensitive ion channel domain-containing protein [Methanobrevibacter olleyae]AMK14833.1 mechanosensitive ion channel protein [Methanobrevibacter olleyae]SFL35226.1 Mechanosensitive ion channel [Methanobrevibacter olleyae]
MLDYNYKILEILVNLFNIENIVYILLIIIGGLIVIRLGDKILSKIEHKFDLNLTAHYLLKDLLKYTVIILAIAWILHVLGINLESIIISLGVVGVAIGFASKDIVSNFISGIFVISDKKIQIGEVIEVNGFKGTIKKIGFRNTTMITQENYEINIPNSLLSTNPYKIYPPAEEYKLRLLVTLPNGMSIGEFKKNLDDTMYSYNWINKEKESKIFAKEFNEKGSLVELNYWVNKYKYIVCGKITILENINKLFDEYNKK